MASPSGPTLRRPLLLSLLSCVLALTAVFPAGATAQSFTFEVEEQMLIEVCGGIVGSCDDQRLTGSLEMTIDREAGTARLDAATLFLSFDSGSIVFPLTAELPLAALSGFFDGQTVTFTTPDGFPTSLSWTMTLTARGGVLNGSFFEGCCDRFDYSFRNISLRDATFAPRSELLVRQGRFLVEATWRDFRGRQGAAMAVHLGDDSGYFWFFDAGNTEVVVKVLDGCNANGHVWVFAAGLTNLEVELVVTDLLSNAQQRYTNPLGTDFAPVLDILAFSGPCGNG